MFLAPIFFGGGSAPRIFGLNLSNRTSFRSCGKVSGRSVEGARREPGERKKKKHHEHFIRPPVTPYGRPNKLCVEDLGFTFWLTLYISINFSIYSQKSTLKSEKSQRQPTGVIKTVQEICVKSNFKRSLLLFPVICKLATEFEFKISRCADVIGDRFRRCLATTMTTESGWRAQLNYVQGSDEYHKQWHYDDTGDADHVRIGAFNFLIRHWTQRPSCTDKQTNVLIARTVFARVSALTTCMKSMTSS